MNESPDRLFGLTIAYVLPGFVSLWGASSLSPVLLNWLSAAPQANPTVASFLYTVFGSLGAGLTVSAARWAVVDSVHHHTGVPFPNPDFSQVQGKLEAFQLAIDMYYRYYQFYANMFVAIAIAGACRAWAGIRPTLGDLAVVVLVELLLLAASRDSLSRYYTRIAQLLGVKSGATGNEAAG